jgi:nucleoside phosphorylase
MSQVLQFRSRDGFKIAIICALPIERNDVEALLNEEYETDRFLYGKAPGDRNIYTTGRLGTQHMVLAYIPGIGTISAATVAANLCSSIKGIEVGIVIGVCSGVPITAGGGGIVLGDVIVSTSVVRIGFSR